MSKPIEISGKHEVHDRYTLTVTYKQRGLTEIESLSNGVGQSARHSSEASLHVRSSEDISGPWTLRLSFEGLFGKIRDEGYVKLTLGGIESEGPGIRPFPPHLVSSCSGGLAEDAIRLGQLRKKKQGDLLLEALQIVEPRLGGVEDSSVS